MLFLVVTTTILVRRLICLRPLSGSRTATTGIGRVAGSVAGRSVWLAVHSGFAVVMAQVRRPVPFRTRKLRPGRGDGTALERVWESSAPPHSTLDLLVESPWGIPGRSFFILLGVPGALRPAGTPIFCFCRPAGRSPLPGVSEGLSCSRAVSPILDPTESESHPRRNGTMWPFEIGGWICR